MSYEMNIGIVDSYIMLRVSMSKMLSKLGFNTIQCNDANQYLRLVEHAHVVPKVCIVHIDNPEIIAFTTARTIKANFPDTIILAYSVYETNDLHLQKIEEYGVDVFLEKNFSAEKIQRVIYSLLVRADRFLLN